MWCSLCQRGHKKIGSMGGEEHKREEYILSAFSAYMARVHIGNLGKEFLNAWQWIKFIVVLSIKN